MAVYSSSNNQFQIYLRKTFALLLVFGLAACNVDSLIEPNELSTVKNAKQWFHAVHGTNGSEIYGGIKVNYLWSDAEVISTKNFSIIEVPVSHEADARISFSGAKGRFANGTQSLLVYKRTEDQFDAKLCFLQSDSDNLKFIELFRKKPSNFSGEILFTSLAGIPQDIAFLEKGKLTHPTNQTNSLRVSQFCQSYVIDVVHSWVCVGDYCAPKESETIWGRICFDTPVTFNSNDVSLDPADLFSGMFMGNVEVEKELTINNELTDPCLQKVFSKISDPNLTNNITRILHDTFGATDNVNVTFGETRSLPNGNIAETIAQTTNMGSFNVFIDLNINVLPSASQEYIADTFFHEIIHGYLSALGIDLNNQEGQHVAIATTYMNSLIQAQISLFPSLPQLHAKAIVIAGLGQLADSNPALFNQILAQNGLTQNQVVGIVNGYKNGQTGTPCGM